MNKISKNIKKLRSENNMTQDALAEKINVTRQTISSWENGRTQPDIDMLELLAQAFSVGIETVIYGEKKHIGLEPPKTDRRKLMNIVFSTLGSLLTATGLIIILVSVWDKIPQIVLSVLCFAPLLIGGGIAAWIHSKKETGIGRSEGASVAWTAGLIATFALIYMRYNINLGFEASAAALSLMILPISFIMNSVFPLTAYYAIVTFLASSSAFSQLEPLPIALGIILFAFGLIYVFKTPTDDYKRTYSVWLIIISAAVILVCLSFATAEIFHSALFCAIIGILTALYAADNGEKNEYSFRFVAVPSLSVIMVIINYLSPDFLDGAYYLTENKELLCSGIAPLVSVAAISFGIFFGKKSFIKNPVKIAFVCVSAFACIVCFIYSVFAEFINDSEIIRFLIIADSLAMSIIIIIDGIKKMKLLTVNLGLLMLCVEIFLTFVLGNFEPVICGISCVVMGGILLFINFRLSKSFKVKESEQNA